MFYLNFESSFMCNPRQFMHVCPDAQYIHDPPNSSALLYRLRTTPGQAAVVKRLISGPAHQLILFKLETSKPPRARYGWSSMSQPKEKLAGSTYKSCHSGSSMAVRMLIDNRSQSSLCGRVVLSPVRPCPTKTFPWTPSK